MGDVRRHIRGRGQRIKYIAIAKKSHEIIPLVQIRQKRRQLCHFTVVEAILAIDQGKCVWHGSHLPVAGENRPDARHVFLG